MKHISSLRATLPIALLLLICYIVFVQGVFPVVRLSMQLSNAASDDYVLYLDTGDGYNEADTVRRWVVSRRHSSTVSFPLPFRSLQRIRFDPGTQSQELSIKRICLSTLVRESCWTPMQLVGFTTPLSSIQNISVDDEGLKIRTLGNDPYLAFGSEISNVHNSLVRMITWILIPAILLLCVTIYIRFRDLQKLLVVTCDFVARRRSDRPYVFLTVISVILAGLCYWSGDKRFTDAAFFGGDTWEYQSMAVNWAEGHGLKFGAIEEFDIYRFDDASTDKSYYAGFIRRGDKGGTWNHLRTPGYPYFLGIVYATFGVSPFIAKLVQLWLVAIACGALPLIGFHFWGRIGAWGGIAAAPISFLQLESTAATLMTEPLIIFALSLLMLAFVLWEKSTGTVSSLVLGACLALCLLVKGSMIFLPLLFIPYCVWNMKRRHVHGRRFYGIALGSAFILVLGTWSAVATFQAGESILLSTQSESVLLDGNNEYSIRDGAQWRPDWRSDQDSFYNREDIRSHQPLVRVLMFFGENIRQVPGLINDKIRIGLSFPYLTMIAVLFLLESYVSLRRRVKERVRAMVDLGCGSAILMAMAYYGVLALGHYYLYAALGLLAARALLIKGDTYFLPTPMFLIFLNFLGLTIVLFGDRRFTMVMDHLVILAAFSFTLRLFSDWIKRNELLHPVQEPGEKQL